MTETCTSVSAWPITKKTGTAGSEYFMSDIRFNETHERCRCWLTGAGGSWFVDSQCIETVFYLHSLVRIFKEDGSFGTYDEPGELWVWSPSNALGYYNNEKAYVPRDDIIL